MAYGIWLANRWNFLTPAIGSLLRGSWQPNFHTGQNFIQNQFDSENMFTDLLWYELKVFLKESYFLAVTAVCYLFVCFKSDAIVCVHVCVCMHRDYNYITFSSPSVPETTPIHSSLLFSLLSFKVLT